MSLLDEPAVDGFLSIGRSRTILGLVGVSERNIGDIESDPLRAGSRHALYFATDAVLLDDHLEPVLPDAQWLERLVDLERGTVFDVDQSYLSERRIAGWSAVHGGPKPIDSTIERGSVLPFSCSDNDALTRIADRLRSGVGWRAAEGFGVIRLDHPIHAASWPNAEAPAGAVQDDIAEFRREVAMALRSESNDRIGYSLWSTYRDASPMPRQPAREVSIPRQLRPDSPMSLASARASGSSWKTPGETSNGALPNGKVPSTPNRSWSASTRSAANSS